MRARACVQRITWTVACLLLAPSPVSADEPLPPPHRYTKCSASGVFCVTSDPSGGTSAHTSAEPEIHLWQVPAWFRVAYLHDDGEHLVTGFDGMNLVPVDDPERAQILEFWHRGKLLELYTLGDLGYRREDLRRTVSHYVWGDYVGFDADGHFGLRMLDGASLVFDVASGKLLQRVKQKGPAEPLRVR